MGMAMATQLIHISIYAYHTSQVFEDSEQIRICSKHPESGFCWPTVPGFIAISWVFIRFITSLTDFSGYEMLRVSKISQGSMCTYAIYAILRCLVSASSLMIRQFSDGIRCRQLAFFDQKNLSVLPCFPYNNPM